MERHLAAAKIVAVEGSRDLMCLRTVLGRKLS
jgi:hypothetical protein